MNNVTIIAAIGKNKELGKNNDLIWHLKEDMLFFKENTTGKIIVMGINTFNSLPKLLPNRVHIVLTHQDINIDNVYICHNMYDLLSFIKSVNKEVMIIGGASIYKLFIDYANKMLLTEINKEEKDADTYFPSFDENNWNKTIIKEVEENNINYKHVRYLRK